MPKHGWRWRTDKLRAMSAFELGDYLRDEKVTGKVARWAYRRAIKESEHWSIGVPALERIVTAERSPWARSWLWRELDRWKHDPFGDWIVIALTRYAIATSVDVLRFVEIYKDPQAHPYVRGSAVFGMSKAVEVSRWPERPAIDRETLVVLRATCDRALKDENSYARAGACWLAGYLGGFEEDLERLSHDKTQVEPGSGTVSDYAGWE